MGLLGMVLVILISTNLELGLAWVPGKAMCRVKEFKSCYLYEHNCPSECPYYCNVDCASCKPVCSCNFPGAVCQDPRFVGGDGVAFYFHGKKGHNFCLLSDPDLHINAHFIGKSKPSMKRDFTWIQSIAILFGPHRLFIGAHKASTWDESLDHLIIFHDKDRIRLEPKVGSAWQAQVHPGLKLTRTRPTNEVVAEAIGKFKITARVVPITMKESRIHGYNITEEDCFAHLELGFKFYGLSDNVSGVLGQTYREGYRTRVKIGASMSIMGGDREFATSNVFAPDCAVARFDNHMAARGMGSEGGL